MSERLEAGRDGHYGAFAEDRGLLARVPAADGGGARAMNNRTRGKQLERATAKRLAGKRLGVTGLATADVDAGPWSVECKSRQHMPHLIREAMAQAVRNAPEGKCPLVVLHELNARHDNDIVCMRMADWIAWHGEMAAESLVQEVRSERV